MRGREAHVGQGVGLSLIERNAASFGDAAGWRYAAIAAAPRPYRPELWRVAMKAGRHAAQLCRHAQWVAQPLLQRPPRQRSQLALSTLATATLLPS